MRGGYALCFRVIAVRYLRIFSNIAINTHDVARFVVDNALAPTFAVVPPRDIGIHKIFSPAVSFVVVEFHGVIVLVIIERTRCQCVSSKRGMPPWSCLIR